MVPCDPIEYLNADYGNGTWQQPKKALSGSALSEKPKEEEKLKANEYKWPNLHYFKKYTDEQVLNVRWYHKNSSIDYGTNIGYIKSRLKNKLADDQIRQIIDKRPIVY